MLSESLYLLLFRFENNRATIYHELLSAASFQCSKYKTKMNYKSIYSSMFSFEI